MKPNVWNEKVRASFDRFVNVRDTDEGLKLETHCLYPSFDPVYAYIAKIGESYNVHDGCGAYRSAWDHGKEGSLIRRILFQQAASHELSVVGDAIVGKAISEDWLVATVLAVANASALAAHTIVAHSAAAAEYDLADRIYTALSSVIPISHISRSWRVTGRSGKNHEFDFGVRLFDDRWILIDSVSPHHVSIAAKYVAFSDTKSHSEQIAARFAVYDRPLQEDDASLLMQVADLVPFLALPAGVRREMAVQ
jgi:hypothetical protein